MPLTHTYIHTYMYTGHCMPHTFASAYAHTHTFTYICVRVCVCINHTDVFVKFTFIDNLLLEKCNPGRKSMCSHTDKHMHVRACIAQTCFRVYNSLFLFFLLCLKWIKQQNNKQQQFQLALFRVHNKEKKKRKKTKNEKRKRKETKMSRKRNQ